MVSDVHSLTAEALVKIFSYLDPRSKLSASSTCKRWMQVMNDSPRLFEDICVCFKGNTTANKQVFERRRLTRSFCNFDFRLIDVNREFIFFLQQFSSQFRRLSFEACIQSEDQYRDKIRHCNNLKELRSIGCNAWTMFSHLPQLTILHVTLLEKFRDRDWMQLQEMVPLSLQEFGMAFCYARNSPAICPPFDDFIWRRRLTLESLKIADCTIRGAADAVLKMSKMEGLGIKRLQLTHSQFVGILSQICANQPSLVSLDLSDSRDLGDVITGSVCCSLPRLQELKLRNCKNVDHSLSKILRLDRLRSLDLDSCKGIREATFISSARGLTCRRNLWYLNLRQTHIDDRALRLLLPQLHELRELNLSCCRVTDTTLSIINRCLASLRRLDLSGCAAITDAGLRGTADVGARPAPLTDLKGLEALNLSGCRQVTGQCLTEVVRFEWLQLLQLNVYEYSEAVVSELRRNNPGFMRIGCAPVPARNAADAAEMISRMDEGLELFR